MATILYVWRRWIVIELQQCCPLRLRGHGSNVGTRKRSQYEEEQILRIGEDEQVSRIIIELEMSKKACGSCKGVR